MCTCTRATISTMVSTRVLPKYSKRVDEITLSQPYENTIEAKNSNSAIWTKYPSLQPSSFNISLYQIFILIRLKINRAAHTTRKLLEHASGMYFRISLLWIPVSEINGTDYYFRPLHSPLGFFIHSVYLSFPPAQARDYFIIPQILNKRS